jgi:hypothetical protein
LDAAYHKCMELVAAGRLTALRYYTTTEDGSKPVCVLTALAADTTTPEATPDLRDSETAATGGAPSPPPATAEPTISCDLVAVTGSAAGSTAPVPAVTCQTHFATSRFRNAAIYLVIVPTLHGGVSYVGATTNWRVRLREHLTGLGCPRIFAAVKHLATLAEREAFVETHILLDLATDVPNLPALLDALLGAPPAGLRHTVDAVRFLLAHFEAHALDWLFFESGIAYFNIHLGVFGHTASCYAHVNGALGGAASAAIGADGRAGTGARGGGGLAMIDRGTLGAAASNAIGADGRAGTGARGGEGMANKDRGALGGAASAAIGADGRAGTGARGGEGMANVDRGTLGAAASNAIGADGRAGTGARGGEGLANEDRGRLAAKTAGTAVKLRHQESGKEYLIIFRMNKSGLWFAHFPVGSGKSLKLTTRALAADYALATRHPRPRIPGGMGRPPSVRFTPYTHVVVEAPFLRGAAPHVSLTAADTTPAPQTTDPSTASTATTDASTTTPAATPPTMTPPAAPAGLLAYFAPRSSSSTEGAVADADTDGNSEDDFE